MYGATRPPGVAVVGAGPSGGIEVVLFERESEVEYLPGTIPVFLGKTPRRRWRQRLSLARVEVIIREVEITIERLSETFAAGLERSFDRWRELRGG